MDAPSLCTMKITMQLELSVKRSTSWRCREIETFYRNLDNSLTDQTFIPPHDRSTKPMTNRNATEKSRIYKDSWYPVNLRRLCFRSSEWNFILDNTSSTLFRRCIPCATVSWASACPRPPERRSASPPFHRPSSDRWVLVREWRRVDFARGPPSAQNFPVCPAHYKAYRCIDLDDSHWPV